MVLTDLGGAIRRRVVADHQREVGVGLRQERFHRTLHVPLGVVDREPNRSQMRFCHLTSLAVGTTQLVDELP